MPKSSIAKRSIVFNDHKTSVSLEDEFWNALKEIAAKRAIHISRNGDGGVR
jgi:predicted DNA-binding ribbon-helix-helix protein